MPRLATTTGLSGSARSASPSVVRGSVEPARRGLALAETEVRVGGRHLRGDRGLQEGHGLGAAIRLDERRSRAEDCACGLLGSSPRTCRSAASSAWPWSSPEMIAERRAAMARRSLGSGRAPLGPAIAARRVSQCLQPAERVPIRRRQAARARASRPSSGSHGREDRPTVGRRPPTDSVPRPGRRPCRTARDAARRCT